MSPDGAVVVLLLSFTPPLRVFLLTCHGTFICCYPFDWGINTTRHETRSSSDIERRSVTPVTVSVAMSLFLINSNNNNDDDADSKYEEDDDDYIFKLI